MAKRETFEKLVATLAPGVSWLELARRSGVSHRTLLLWREKGPRARPSKWTLGAMAATLGCDVERVRKAIAAGG